MRVGIFTDSWKPYVSGVVHSIDTFVSELDRLGHDTFIFAPGYPRHFRREGNVFRFASLPSGSYRDFRVGIPISPRLRRTARQLRLDIIHAHSPFLMGGMGARLARGQGLPLVFTYHTFYHQYSHYFPVAGSLSSGLLLHLSRHFCNRCDQVITPTTGVRDFLRERGVRTPVAVLPTGIDPARFQGGDPTWLRRVHGLGEGPVLLYVGRIAREKNIQLLLRTFQQVLATIPAARLVLAGDGPALDGLRAEAGAMGFEGRVRFIGSLTGRSLRDCYVGADVFVFPSETDTQGIVINEAQAAGLPVVAVRALATADLVRNGMDGFLCPPGERELAGAVLKILEDGRLRAAMSRAAAARAETFSAPVLAGRLVRIYEDLVYSRRWAGNAG